VLVALGANLIARTCIRRWWQVALVAGALTTALEVAMDRVAMALDYRDWDVAHAPPQNHLAWFAISAVVAASLELPRVRTESRLLAHHFAVQLVFFLVPNAAVV
jgi:hypothetical protein